MYEGHCSVDVFLDLDTGLARCGVPVGARAQNLYQLIVETEGIRAGGFHLYDGQNRQTDLAERRSAVLAGWESASSFRDSLVAEGWPVPRIVCGGTGSFPVFAEIDDPTIELSPGTCVFQDKGYGERFPDLDFAPAAVLFTRVISRPTNDRVTLDLGYKAVASDPPAEKRVVIPSIPDARLVLQNEEHLVIKTSDASQWKPGDEVVAVPQHVCPTTALHKQAYVVRDGEVSECWDVASRDRCLTI